MTTPKSACSVYILDYHISVDYRNEFSSLIKFVLFFFQGHIKGEPEDKEQQKRKYAKDERRQKAEGKDIFCKNLKKMRKYSCKNKKRS